MGCAKKHWRATSEFSYILYLNVSIWERAHRKRLESGGETWKVTGRTGYPLHPSRPVGSFPVFLVNMLQFEALCWTCVQHKIGMCPQPPPDTADSLPQLAAVCHCAQRVGSKAKKHSCSFFWRQRRKASLSLFLQFRNLLFKVPRWELSIASAPGKRNWQPDVFFAKQNLSWLGNVNTVNLTYSRTEKKRCGRNLANELADDWWSFFFRRSIPALSHSLSRPHRLFFQIPSKNRWSHSGTLMRPQWHSERWDVRHRPGPVSLMANQRCDPVWPLHAAAYNRGGPPWRSASPLQSAVEAAARSRQNVPPSKQQMLRVISVIWFIIFIIQRATRSSAIKEWGRRNNSTAFSHPSISRGRGAVCRMIASVFQKLSWHRFECLTQTRASCVKSEAWVHAVRYCCITFILTAAHTTPCDWDWKAGALVCAVWVTNPSLNVKNLVEEDVSSTPFQIRVLRGHAMVKTLRVPGRLNHTRWQWHPAYLLFP